MSILVCSFWNLFFFFLLFLVFFCLFSGLCIQASLAWLQQWAPVSCFWVRRSWAGSIGRVHGLVLRCLPSLGSVALAEIYINLTGPLFSGLNFPVCLSLLPLQSPFCFSLTSVWPDVVFCCCNPSASRLHPEIFFCSVIKSHYLSYCVLPFCHLHPCWPFSSDFPLIKKAFLSPELPIPDVFLFSEWTLDCQSPQWFKNTHTSSCRPDN